MQGGLPVTTYHLVRGFFEDFTIRVETATLDPGLEHFHLDGVAIPRKEATYFATRGEAVEYIKARHDRAVAFAERDVEDGQFCLRSAERRLAGIRAMTFE